MGHLLFCRLLNTYTLQVTFQTRGWFRCSSPFGPTTVVQRQVPLVLWEDRDGVTNSMETPPSIQQPVVFAALFTPLLTTSTPRIFLQQGLTIAPNHSGRHLKEDKGAKFALHPWSVSSEEDERTDCNGEACVLLVWVSQLLLLTTQLGSQLCSNILPANASSKGASASPTKRLHSNAKVTARNSFQRKLRQRSRFQRVLFASYFQTFWPLA